MQVFESGEVQDMCGKDVSFCLDAKEAGFEIWCDPRIRVGHEKHELFDILDGDKVLYENLTQDQYFDMIEDLAQDFYQNGGKNPQNLKTVIKKVNTNGTI